MPWDAVRLWVGSLGPVVALGAAVVPYWRNSKDSRRAQATHLYCHCSPKYELSVPGDGLPTGDPESDGIKAFPLAFGNSLFSPEATAMLLQPDADLSMVKLELHEYAERVKVELHSTSDEPFFNIAVWITDAQRKDQLAATLGQLAPRGRERHYVYFDRGTLPASPLHVRLEFQDANGRCWQRTGTDPVKRMRHLTKINTSVTSPDHLLVPLKPKPDFYSKGLRMFRSMRAHEAASLSGSITLSTDPTSGSTSNDQSEVS